MKNAHRFFFSTSALFVSALLAACGGDGDSDTAAAAPAAAATTPVPSSISTVGTVSQIGGDGQKVVYAVLKYAANVDTASLSTQSYSVSYTKADTTVGTRKVVGVWTSNGNFLNHGGVNIYSPQNPEGTTIDTTPVTIAEVETAATGPYVILKLESQSPLLATGATDGRGSPPITVVNVVQALDVKQTDGTTLAASTIAVASKTSKVLVREQYETNHWYTDPTYGTTIIYDIYKPKNYAGNTAAYPLIVFCPDSGGVSTDPTITLSKNLGSVVWASPEWRASGGQEAFVIAIAPTVTFMNDFWENYADVTNAIMGAVRNEIAAHAEIDPNRVYTTGQSMGAMNSLVMMSLDRQATLNGYPSPGALVKNDRADNTPQTRDLFTAGMIVAGQWNTDTVSVMGNSRIFYITSGDDGFASTWGNKAVARWVTNGHEVVRGWINGSDGFAAAPSGYSYDPSTHKAVIQSMLTAGTGVQKKASGANTNAHLYYLNINAGTGLHDANFAPLAGGHPPTWALAYYLPLAKEWLFTQSGNLTSTSVLDAATPANSGSGPRDVNTQGTKAVAQGAGTWFPQAGETWAQLDARLAVQIPNPTP